MSDNLNSLRYLTNASSSPIKLLWDPSLGFGIRVSSIPAGQRLPIYDVDYGALCEQQGFLALVKAGSIVVGPIVGPGQIDNRRELIRTSVGGADATQFPPGHALQEEGQDS